MRGFSLPEVVISSALLGMLVLILAGVTTAQFRVSSRVGEKVTLERAHLLLHESLRGDVVSTSVIGISPHPSGEGLAVQPSQTVTAPEGTLTYSTQKLVAYRKTARGVERWTWPLSPPLALTSPPQRLDAGQWTALTVASGRRTQVFQWVDEFRVQWRNRSPLQVDCLFLHEDRRWRVSYRLHTRQNP